MAYSKYELGPSIPLNSSGSRMDSSMTTRVAGNIERAPQAKAVLRDAIGCLKNSHVLRIALAEVEEESGCQEACLDVLKTALQEVPCGYAFSVLQRCVRRMEGQTEARQCFSDTYSMREQGKLNHEVKSRENCAITIHA
jgi:hypothetical protein